MTVPLVDFSSMTPVRPARHFYGSYGKRAIDLILVALAAPVILPVLAVILIVTALSGGKPLYIQRRIGRGGREFRCWKVRTMVRNADGVLAKMIASDAETAAEWHSNQKLVNDPRITRFGRLLRRTSLDELPQLWNVLTGDMSLVGPRPFTPDQKALYAEGRGDAAYYALRPGISGLWQVSRRNAGSFAERVHYDELYGRDLSFTADLHILWRTCSVVLMATGL